MGTVQINNEPSGLRIYDCKPIIRCDVDAAHDSLIETCLIHRRRIHGWRIAAGMQLRW